MTIKKQRKTDIIYFHSTGMETYLNTRIWRGLFEACNGHRYLIVQRPERMIAITLRHTYLPAFSYQTLHKQPLEYGQWWGAASLRLTHGAKGRVPRNTTGLITVKDDYVFLSCHGEDGKVEWVHIAFAVWRDECERFAYCDGWVLDSPSAGGAVFLNRSPGGRCEVPPLQLDVPPESHGLIDIQLDPGFEMD